MRAALILAAEAAALPVLMVAVCGAVAVLHYL